MTTADRTDTQELSRADWLRTAVSENESRLIVYATHLLSDVGRARDAVQDTFVKLCAQPREKVEGHLVQWLYKACRNRCFEIRRKEKRMIPLEDERMERLIASSNHPAESLQRDEDMSHIRKIIMTLPERQQEVVRLKFQNELSYKQISGITNMSVSHVGVTLHTAIKTIREKLNPAAGTAPVV